MRFASKGGTYRKEEEEVAVRWPLVPPPSWPPLFLFDPLLGPLPPAPPLPVSSKTFFLFLSPVFLTHIVPYDHVKKLCPRSQKLCP